MNSSLTLIDFSAMTLLGGLLAYDHAEHKGDEQLSVPRLQLLQPPLLPQVQRQLRARESRQNVQTADFRPPAHPRHTSPACPSFSPSSTLTRIRPSPPLDLMKSRTALRHLQVVRIFRQRVYADSSPS